MSKCRVIKLFLKYIFNRIHPAKFRNTPFNLQGLLIVIYRYLFNRYSTVSLDFDDFMIP